MTTNRSKILLAAGIVCALALLAGVGYALDIAPFKERNEVKADEVCASLGSSSVAAEALRKLLPEESSYSFEDDLKRRVDVTDTGYESSCFVSGGGDQLLVAKARLMPDDSAANWTEWVKGTAAEPSSVASATPFATDEEAVASLASERFAAVFVPCTSAGQAPGGQYDVSVSAELKQAGGSGGAAARGHLIELVKNAAAYAHDEAKCDTPAAS